MGERKGRVVYQLIMAGILALAVLGSLGVLAMRWMTSAAFAGPIELIAHQIRAAAVTEVSDDELRRGAIDGMLATLGDPYSVYVPASERAAFEKDLFGEYVGIGVSVEPRDGFIVVQTPLEDSPALEAGVMPGDKLLEVEGEAMTADTIDRAVELLTGEPGTGVSFVVGRSGSRLPLSVTRRKITTRSVKGVERSGESWDYFMDKASGIAYIRITQVTGSTLEEFEGAVEAIQSAGGARGVVLDLRANPGGLLDIAIEIADLMLESGVIVSTRGRNTEEEIASAGPGDVFAGAPMAVLIDGQSASAAEILAGALLDNDRAIALGQRTFGKGSVQSVYDLPGNLGQLKLTEQLYYLPSGRSIHRSDSSLSWGVDPSDGFFVPLSDEEQFEVLRRRVELDVINGEHEEQHWDDPEWVRTTAKDAQLSAALTTLRARVETGKWIKVGGEQPAITEALAGELRGALRARDQMELSLQMIDERIAKLTSADTASVVETDLWPDETDVAGGTIVVRDASGNEVATLRVTRDDLERWLISAGLEPASTGSTDDGTVKP